MDAKTLLGLGAIGGAIYLATSKKAQAKVKKTTGLSDRAGTKPLSKLDKKVIMAFIDKRNADNKLFSSNGKVLDGHWMGGGKIAEWKNGKIKLNDLGSKKAQQVHNFIKKETPKRDLESGLSDRGNPYKTKLVYSYDRNSVGEYKPTKLDREKNNTNRLVSITGKYYTVITKDNKILEFVGKRNFDKWAKNNNYVTDF